MGRTRRSSTDLLRGIVRGPTMGFHSQSFRFEGGGRQMIGLKRTGKSCRLRWVNYLHPGLKRGKMTPHEEQLVLKLHSEWGNRWSRIARRLPGRTDNEIKNYWRTHMRKKAQESKRAAAPSSPSTSIVSSSSSTDPVVNSTEKTTTSFQSMGGPDMSAFRRGTNSTGYWWISWRKQFLLSSNSFAVMGILPRHAMEIGWRRK